VAHEQALPAVVVTGAPATGKSTLGRLLAGRLRAALLDQDVATEPLVDVVRELIGTGDLDDPRLAGLTRGPRYEVLAALAADNLSAGVPVVLVAPYTAERSSLRVWEQLRDRLSAAGGAPLLCWLSLPPEEILRRLRDRGAARDHAKLLGGSEYLVKLAKVAEAPVVPHLELPAVLPVEQLVERVLDAFVTSSP
jgi:predicted kinase